MIYLHLHSRCGLCNRILPHQERSSQHSHRTSPPHSWPASSASTHLTSYSPSKSSSPNRPFPCTPINSTLSFTYSITSPSTSHLTQALSFFSEATHLTPFPCLRNSFLLSLSFSLILWLSNPCITPMNQGTLLQTHMLTPHNLLGEPGTSLPYHLTRYLSVHFPSFIRSSSYILEILDAFQPLTV